MNMDDSGVVLAVSVDALGVASVMLNRPHVHNAFDETLVTELARVFKNLDKNDHVRLAVLSGNGKSFCAGGDLNWMRSMKNFSREQNSADSGQLASMFATLRNFSKPLIGVVHGVALGGGSGLAAVCDFVLATEDSRFGFTETRLGLLPAVIGPYAIEKIGLSAARAYFISGMPFSAQRALEIGLVHRVVPHAALAGTRDEVVAEFLKAAPLASREAKSLIGVLAAIGNNHEAATKTTIDALVKARVSDEGQEGMDALLSGRRASWIP